MIPKSLKQRFAVLMSTVGAVACVGAAGFAVAGGGGGSLLPVPTTLADFFGPGTQPSTITDPMLGVGSCLGCHGSGDATANISEPWAASMMGQAARDPLFFACLAIAEQDADFAGDLCIRCHTPAGWLEGRSVPTDGSGLSFQDFEGVSCHFCHRSVDPDGNPGAPAEDAAILAALTDPPVNPHSGHFVVDPEDRRRGPYELDEFFPFHEWLESPFHESSAMCATCHDVSNPVYDAQPDGSFTLNALDAPHLTHDKYDQFPLERTYSEWLMSDFAQGPIDMGGRFGGNDPLVSSCQDCHMPKTDDRGCAFSEARPDLPRHYFNGGNTWVLRAVRNLYPDIETNLTEQSVDDSIARAVAMLQAASDMELTVTGSNELNVRVINQSGHKLPTGYPEGRRMWVNVRFLDGSGAVVLEHGAYNDMTAVLDTASTKVYEGKLGLDSHASTSTGIPEGESFHFVLNNKWFKDNRIPPRGFTNANFDLIQATPVGATYADGQFWDDTAYPIPAAAESAEVSVWYQTASKEYIEFLRDENVTNNTGDVLYDQWELLGKSAPVEMDFATIGFGPSPCNGADQAEPFGVLDFNDVVAFLTAFSLQDPAADLAPPMPGFDFNDVVAFLQIFAAGCP